MTRSKNKRDGIWKVAHFQNTVIDPTVENDDEPSGTPPVFPVPGYRSFTYVTVEQRRVAKMSRDLIMRSTVYGQGAASGNHGRDQAQAGVAPG